MAQEEFRQGGTAEWNAPQGKTRGTVRRKLTSSTGVGGQKIDASEDDPPYLLESEESGEGGRPQTRRPKQGIEEARSWPTTGSG